MKRKLILLLFVVVSMLLLSACQRGAEDTSASAPQEGREGMGRIISTITAKAGEALRSLPLPRAGHSLFMSDERLADERMEQIVAAIKKDDKDALKSLFSAKAMKECADWDDEVNALFDFLQGDISSWERDVCPSDESVEYGKRSLMIRPSYKVVTDMEEYSFFLIDYAIDTIDPDNEGVYMLEVCRLSYDGEWESWMDRMRAGISIVE